MCRLGRSHEGDSINSHGCCNKLLQTRWLTRTYLYSLTVVEARSPESVSLAQLCSLKGCRGGFVPGLSGGCGFSLACGLITAVSASLVTSLLCLLHVVYLPLPLLYEDVYDGLEGPPG